MFEYLKIYKKLMVVGQMADAPGGWDDTKKEKTKEEIVLENKLLTLHKDKDIKTRIDAIRNLQSLKSSILWWAKTEIWAKIKQELINDLKNWLAFDSPNLNDVNEVLVFLSETTWAFSLPTWYNNVLWRAISQLDGKPLIIQFTS